jgi:hypothetical protein
MLSYLILTTDNIMSPCNLFTKTRSPVIISIFNGMKGEVVWVMLKTLFNFINEMSEGHVSFLFLVTL